MSPPPLLGEVKAASTQLSSKQAKDKQKQAGAGAGAGAGLVAHPLTPAMAQPSSATSSVAATAATEKAGVAASGPKSASTPEAGQAGRRVGGYPTIIRFSRLIHFFYFKGVYLKLYLQTLPI